MWTQAAPLLSIVIHYRRSLKGFAVNIACMSSNGLTASTACRSLNGLTISVACRRSLNRFTISRHLHTAHCMSWRATLVVVGSITTFKHMDQKGLYHCSWLGRFSLSCMSRSQLNCFYNFTGYLNTLHKNLFDPMHLLIQPCPLWKQSATLKESGCLSFLENRIYLANVIAIAVFLQSSSML